MGEARGREEESIKQKSFPLTASKQQPIYHHVESLSLTLLNPHTTYAARSLACLYLYGTWIDHFKINNNKTKKSLKGEKGEEEEEEGGRSRGNCQSFHVINECLETK